MRWTSRYSKDRFLKDKELLTCSQKITRDGGVTVRKLYLLDESARGRLGQVQKHAQRYAESGVTIRLLDEEEWIPSSYSASPEGYIIADEDLVMIQKRQESRIRFGEDDIREYRNNFEHNWHGASDLDAYLENAL